MPTAPLAHPANTASPSPDGANRVRGDQWHLDYLNVEEAHQISRGAGVVVAVTDTGVYPHTDLHENVLDGIDLLSETGGNGHEDHNGHGTGMAGLIAAHGRRDGTGALGIAPQAKILPIRSFKSNSEGDTDRLAESIEKSISAGADIISISAGGNGVNSRLLRAIDAARAANILVVASAGNRPNDAHVIWPAALKGVISVGGVDRRGVHAEVSVVGPEIDIVAPAVEIYSTSYDDLYLKGTGTSSAAAIVAGAAALIRAKYPYLPADEVAHRLTATAIDKGPPGRDDQYGYGVIDLVAALTADVPPRGFESVPTSAPDDGGPTTAADGPWSNEEGAATVRGLVTLGVLLAAGGAWALFVRHRRRSDDPPPRITR
ncbi:type VII secretion-associated serine protease mycosin [Micromonospora sp. FIMYZ51]|uniref:type VII secretion-associated serine protease mycosin n=1 Tax=Micromonospora sp. FIMYZ51 TaxID=3051832 RepID=UPI00311D3F0C